MSYVLHTPILYIPLLVVRGTHAQSQSNAFSFPHSSKNSEALEFDSWLKIWWFPVVWAFGFGFSGGFHSTTPGDLGTAQWSLRSMPTGFQHFSWHLRIYDSALSGSARRCWGVHDFLGAPWETGKLAIASIAPQPIRKRRASESFSKRVFSFDGSPKRMGGVLFMEYLFWEGFNGTPKGKPVFFGGHLKTDSHLVLFTCVFSLLDRSRRCPPGLQRKMAGRKRVGLELACFVGLCLSRLVGELARFLWLHKKSVCWI